MWPNDNTVEVQRSVTERVIDDLEYEFRKKEAKAERFFDSLFRW